MSSFERKIIAVRTDISKERIQARILSQYKNRRWVDEEARKAFWVYSMVDGIKNHRKIASILNLTPNQVRTAILRLMFEGLVITKEGEMNIILLQESFEDVKKNSLYFAELFYKRLFKEYPATRELFVKPGDTEEDIMQKQYRNFMSIFAFAVNSVINEQVIDKELQELGARHAGYGVQSYHYDIVGLVLLATFSEYYAYIKKKWSEDLFLVWHQVYDALSTAMRNYNKELPH